MTAKKLTTFRISEQTLKNLNDLKSWTGKCWTALIEDSISQEHKYQQLERSNTQKTNVFTQESVKKVLESEK